MERSLASIKISAGTQPQFLTLKTATTSVRALHLRTYNVKGSALVLSKMSSKFFRTGDDTSSESSSEEEEELYSDSEEEEQEASESGSDKEGEDEESSSEDEKAGGKKTGAMAFFRGAGSDEDESTDDEQVHVVKSAKDKRLEELEATSKAIENGKKINDWGSISAGMLYYCGHKRSHLLTTFAPQSSIRSTVKLSSFFNPEACPSCISRPSPT